MQNFDAKLWTCFISNHIVLVNAATTLVKYLYLTVNPETSNKIEHEFSYCTKQLTNKETQGNTSHYQDEDMAKTAIEECRESKNYVRDTNTK